MQLLNEGTKKSCCELPNIKNANLSEKTLIPKIKTSAIGNTIISESAKQEAGFEQFLAYSISAILRGRATPIPTQTIGIMKDNTLRITAYSEKPSIPK